MLAPKACFLFICQNPLKKKLKHNQLRTNLCSLSSGEKIILHFPISATCDKTEDVLLASSATKHLVTSAVAAALKCDIECSLFSFTKCIALLLLLKPEEKKNPSPLFNPFICLNLTQMTKVIT